ncbi:MAG: hypothetical protein K2M31_03715 [Muribaculaceae bacterium]|nr:hypothetical protein [Muribaculaceae bacterium]
MVSVSCHKDEPAPDPVSTTPETSILLYAVASNNLSTSFEDDLNEMRKGLDEVDLAKVDYFVYSVTQSLDPGPVLRKAVRDKQSGKVEFMEVKKYDRTISSVDPARISQVIADFKNLSNGETKGLILWSHSTAWAAAPGTVLSRGSVPSNISESSNTTEYPADENIGKMTPEEIRWWGQDIYEGTAYYCNLPQLASAVPDDFFDFIWFDCCYMSSIEVIYEMKEKADMFVAYPTEVLAEGAPYDVVLPYIATPRPNLIAAADVMSEYYLSSGKVFTIAVIDPSPLEEIADLAQAAIPGTRLRAYKLQKYSRNGYYFYDFGQYTSTWGESLGEKWDKDKFTALMDRLIVYKNCGDRFFTGQPIDKDNFSGISCGYFDYNPSNSIFNMDEDSGSYSFKRNAESYKSKASLRSSESFDEEDQKYYLELQWFERVYKPFWPAFLQ